MIFVVGLLDDHRDTQPKTKFIVIIIATVFLYFDGLCINNIGYFFGINISLSWFALPFTMFAVSGFTNALNLIDGLDGLAASISMIILGSFFAIGYMHNDLFMMVLSSSFLVSVWAFLFYNWYPASIFMGDSGSLTLGFVISILAIKSLDYISAVSILFIAAIPILDTVIVMTRRKLEGGSAFDADAYHMHHLLKNFFKGSTQKTVLFLATLQLLYSLAALQCAKEMDEGFLLLLFVLNAVVLYLLFNRLKKKQSNNNESK
jgi:UDP-GlcNAc:undecaprenyl-phosphate GlcNAc-1-phosphate transferase